MRLYTVLVAVLGLCATAFAEGPNVLWIVAEDTSPWMGCYDDPINAGATPTIDALAESGVLFRRAFVPAPVCSPCRSALKMRSSVTSARLSMAHSSASRTIVQIRTGNVGSSS